MPPDNNDLTHQSLPLFPGDVPDRWFSEHKKLDNRPNQMVSSFLLDVKLVSIYLVRFDVQLTDKADLLPRDDKKIIRTSVGYTDVEENR